MVRRIQVKILIMKIVPFLILATAASAAQSVGKTRSPSLKQSPRPDRRKAIPNLLKKQAEPPTPKVGSGTATIPSEVFNLVKAIVGAGALSLPVGVAAFGNAPSAVFPAVALIIIMGSLSANGFATIGRVCAYTGATSYRDAWTRSVGENSSWLPAWSATLKTGLACLAISMVLADSFCSILRTDQRTQVLVGLTVLVLLPLCLMKSLAALAPFSLLGVIGMGYTGVAMAIRYFDGSYSGEEGSLIESVAENMKPLFGDDGWKSVFHPNSLILVCMLSTAFMAHFAAPKFYNELQNNTLPRFNTVVATSFSISIALMALFTACGYLTFGSACSGLVLNNYSPKDVLIGASRIAVALSLVFSYPLVFQGCRDGVLDLLQVPAEKRSSSSFLNLTTICMLGAITLLAATLKDVSLVLALGGATLGNALTYVYPAMMYSSVVSKQERKGESVGVLVSKASAVLGVVVGVIGAKMAL